MPIFKEEPYMNLSETEKKDLVPRQMSMIEQLLPMGSAPNLYINSQ